MKIKHISAVTLAVTDMKRSVQFYEKLGLQRIYGSVESSFSSFRAGDGFINLFLASAPRTGFWGRVILRVEDVDGWYDKLKGSGLHPEQPRNAEWGERYFHLRDPDHHELSFAERID